MTMKHANAVVLSVGVRTPWGGDVKLNTAILESGLGDCLLEWDAIHTFLELVSLNTITRLTSE